MNLFPINQPTLALSISEEALFLVKVKNPWRTTRLHAVDSISLPSGVIRLSSAKSNIENLETFVEQLRNLVKPLNTPISIALSLPDLCARTSIFEFSTFPTKKSEQMAMLNWRFQEDLKLDTAQSRLAYDVYVPTSLADSLEEKHSEQVQVLGTAIRHEIAEQYERACLDANLIPISLSISGLDTFDFYQQTIQEILESEDRRSPNASSGAMFIFMSHWGFTFFAFHDGCPRFVRTKAITIRQEVNAEAWDPLTPSAFQEQEQSFPSIEESLQDSQGSTNSTSVVSPYPSYTVTKVEKEVLATIQYYMETFFQDGAKTFPTNLFVVSDLEFGHTLLPSSEKIQETAMASGLKNSQIQVNQLPSPTDFNNYEMRAIQESHLWSALPGYASLRRA